MDSFGNRLKKIRLENNKSLNEVSEKTGISKSALSKYENKKRVPKSANAKLLADFFNVDINYLLGLNSYDELKNRIFEKLKEKNIVNNFNEELTKGQIDNIMEIFDKALDIYNIKTNFK